MLSSKLLSLVLLGVDPVLWILVFMSVLSVSVTIERLWAYKTIEKEYKNTEYYTLKLVLEQRLGILATMGNNAPFIGLFGTVLGVIQAFHTLGVNSKLGVEPIMQGISEALIATAAGLFVAIPCVIAYNYFVRRMKVVLTKKEAILNGA